MFKKLEEYKIIMVDKDNQMASHATNTSNIPIINAENLIDLIGAELSVDASGTLYFLNGYPNFVLKEIRLDGLGKNEIASIKLELVNLTSVVHPNIHRCYQVIEDDDFLYLLMDHYSLSLDQLIAKHIRTYKPISDELLFYILKQVVDGFVYLHSVNRTTSTGEFHQGLTYLEFKPSNVLISEDGKRFMLDSIGFCKGILHNGSDVAGSRRYMAPETLTYNEISPATDIWSLGIVIYELFTLKKPSFLSRNRGEDVFVDGWKPDLSNVTNDFIRGILERIFVLNPAERLTARDIARLLEAPADPIAELVDSVDELRDHVVKDAALDDNYIMLQTSLAAANTRIESLEKALMTKSTEVSSLREHFEKQSARLSVLEANYTALEQKFMSAIAFIEQRVPSNPTGSSHQMALNAMDHPTKPESTCEEQSMTNQHSIPVTKHQSVSSMTPRAISKLTSAQPQPQVRDHSWTPLMIAAADGDIEEVLKNLHDKDAKNSSGDTALIIAARAGYDGIVEIIEPTFDNGFTALMQAVERGDVATARALIPLQKQKQTTEKICVNNYNIFGGTALMIAAIYGYTELVELLVEHEGGMADNGSRTALMYATVSKQLECVKLLVDKEGGMQTKNGWTALMQSTYDNNLECAKLLVKKEKDLKIIHNISLDGFFFAVGTTALDIAKKINFGNSHSQLIYFLLNK